MIVVGLVWSASRTSFFILNFVMVQVANPFSGKNAKENQHIWTGKPVVASCDYQCGLQIAFCLLAKSLALFQIQTGIRPAREVPTDGGQN